MSVPAVSDPGSEFYFEKLPQGRDLTIPKHLKDLTFPEEAELFKAIELAKKAGLTDAAYWIEYQMMSVRADGYTLSIP